MATLDDKLLGEKVQNYCSSSSENNSDDENEPTTDTRASESKQNIEQWDGTSVNTGPKGVLRDWQRFKQLETERREEQEAEKLNLMKKLSLNCRSQIEDEEAKKEEEELEELLHDDFLKVYLQKRMEEMLTKIKSLPVFGRVINLNSADEFLDAVDKEQKDVTIVIHLYEDNNSSCEAMNGCLTSLSEDYPQVKFCRLKASIAGLSKHFKINGIPALLIYKSGQIMGNFVKMGKEFGDDFYASDVETFLIDHGLLPDKTLVPSLIRGTE
uniref:Phosducin domain-containing protein n=1 Tax=Strigamia maritima TaxID=126957 RepID=T1J184_STRMM